MKNLVYVFLNIFRYTTIDTVFVAVCKGLVLISELAAHFCTLWKSEPRCYNLSPVNFDSLKLGVPFAKATDDD